MGVFTFFQVAMRVRVLESEQQKLRDELEHTKLSLLAARNAHETLELAFNAFRQRVYAWRRWEEPGAPPAETKPLDKAAILAAHRSKQ